MTLPPRFRIAGRSYCSFHVFGGAGLAAAAAASLAAGLHGGLSPAVLALLLVLACLTFLGLAILTRAIAGEERLVYYHHEIAILASLSAALALLGLPVARYLDAAVVGLGTFLFFGRLGCSAVGCCYGRPVRWGWRYGVAHAKAGFPAALCGAPLLPVQWMEAAGVLAITGGAALLFWRGSTAGTPLNLYLGAYAALRFALEFARGDPARRRLRAFTEAQWTSIAILGAVLWSVSPWLVIAPALAAGAGLRRPGWLEPRGVLEIVSTLRELRADPGPDVRSTPRGLRLSKGVLPDGSRIYAMSSAGKPIPAHDVRRLLRIVAMIEGLRPASARIVRRDSGFTAILFEA